jgi:hypothetical protein
MTANVVSPSETLSPRQISKIYDLLEAGMVKSNLPKSLSQQVIEDEGADMVEKFVVDFRNRVEARSEMIVRHFKIDLTKTRRQMIAALGRKEFVKNDVLATMPMVEGMDEGHIYFFQVKHHVPVGEMAHEFEVRGLVPHPLAQVQVNIDDPDFADEHPNGVQWLDKKKYFCYVTCYRWFNEHKVCVGRNDYHWRDGWWFGGVRKPDTK